MSYLSNTTLAVAMLLAAVRPAKAQQVSPAETQRLIRQLSAEDRQAQSDAALKLAGLDSEEVVQDLIDWLDKDTDHPPIAWSEVLDALVSRHGKSDEVRGLLERWAQPTVEEAIRAAGVDGLMRLGVKSAATVASLFEGFGFDSQYLLTLDPIKAIDALGNGGFLAEARQALQTDKQCAGAVVLLGQFAEDPSQAPAAFDVVRPALDARGASICSEAVVFLADLGYRANAAVPRLTKLLSTYPREGGDAQKAVNDAAAAALAGIALDTYEHAELFSRGQLTTQIQQLQGGLDRLRAVDDLLSAASQRPHPLEQRSLRIGIKGLADNRARRIVEPLRDGSFNAFRTHPVLGGVLAYILLMLFARLFLLWLWPLGLLRFNELVQRATDPQTAKELGAFAAPLAIALALTRWLSVFGLLRQPLRALDAWVLAHLPAARERFEQLPTVSRRNVYVTVPLVLDGTLITDPSPAAFRAAFRRGPTRVLIHGEGGAGKTSLACEIGRWGMRTGGDGLCAHALLPVLIDHDLEPGEDRFFHAVRGRLQDLIGEAEPISLVLTEQLLRSRRILVLVDGMSERAEATRAVVQPTDPRFSAAALVVTSRRVEPLAGAIVTRVEPVRVRGDRLSSFMEAYLSQLGSRSLFSDVEYFDACRALSGIVGQRDTTVLLARLYADLLVAAKRRDAVGRADLPTNVPELMFAYLNQLNRARAPGDPDDIAVHGAAAIIAWEAVHKTYQPQAAQRDVVLKALGDKGEEMLRYLEDSLAVIQATGPARDALRLTLDPLAEYLAADRLVRKCAADAACWSAWLSEFADRAADVGAENITGFGHALRDCLSARGGDFGVSPDVAVNVEAILTKD